MNWKSLRPWVRLKSTSQPLVVPRTPAASERSTIPVLMKGRKPLGKIWGTTRSSWFGNRKRSEEHTSELQSQSNLVCRLLLEKKKKHRHARQQPSPRSRYSPSRVTTAYHRRRSPISPADLNTPSNAT